VNTSLCVAVLVSLCGVGVALADGLAAPDIGLPMDYELVFEDDFEDGRADGWMPREGNAWLVAEDQGDLAYSLTKPGEQGRVRACGAYSLIEDHEVADFALVASGRCLTDPATKGRDLCIVFGYQDPEHFYYAHFSAISDALHNAIMKVDGKDREPITIESEGPARLDDLEYHLLKVERNATTGDVRIYIDDMDAPILTARDTTFRRGLVGVGTFDDTGYFDDVMLFEPRD